MVELSCIRLCHNQEKKVADLQRHGVLIAEDEEEIRIVMSAVFEANDFDVFQAADGPSALETFMEHSSVIDLLITDLGLPGLGGMELIEKLHGLKPSLKIIGTSGFGHSNVREELIRAGGDLFLSKPFHIDEMVQTSKELLARA